MFENVWNLKARRKSIINRSTPPYLSIVAFTRYPFLRKEKINKSELRILKFVPKTYIPQANVGYLIYERILLKLSLRSPRLPTHSELVIRFSCAYNLNSSNIAVYDKTISSNIKICNTIVSTLKHEYKFTLKKITENQLSLLSLS